MKKRLFAAVVAVLILLAITYILQDRLAIRKSASVSKVTKLKIATSFYPWAEMATQIGGSNVEVVNITPAGAEPHDYEPTPQDIVQIQSSKIFIYNGGGVDAWADKLKPELQSKGIKVLRMMDYIGNGIVEKNQQQGAPDTLDPHIWLDPIMYSSVSIQVRDALSHVDSAKAAEYKVNTTLFNEKLAALNELFKQMLSACKKNEIVSSHMAFHYMGNRYGFSIRSIAGLSPDQEPSAKDIATITDFIKGEKIKYVFTEPLVSSKIAETISHETGAKTLILNPLEGLSSEEKKKGFTYFSVMNENLINLHTALECQ